MYIYIYIYIYIRQARRVLGPSSPGLQGGREAARQATKLAIAVSVIISSSSSSSSTMCIIIIVIISSSSFMFHAVWPRFRGQGGGGARGQKK